MEGRNSPSLTVRQQQELDYQQHQLQQQQILAQHSRSRPTSLYQSSLTNGTASPTTSQFASTIGGMHSPYQSHFSHHDGGMGSNNGSNGNGAINSPSSPATSLQALQESMAAKERAQTVALMKERLARMKTQTLTSSQVALQQFHQQQAAGPERGNSHGSGNGNGTGNGGGQYF
jgi:hypothetical protein